MIGGLLTLIIVINCKQNQLSLMEIEPIVMEAAYTFIIIMTVTLGNNIFMKTKAIQAERSQSE